MKQQSHTRAWELASSALLFVFLVHQIEKLEQFFHFRLRQNVEFFLDVDHFAFSQRRAVVRALSRMIFLMVQGFMLRRSVEHVAEPDLLVGSDHKRVNGERHWSTLSVLLW